VCGVCGRNTHDRRMSVCESVAAAGRGAGDLGDGVGGGGVAPGWRPELMRFMRRGRAVVPSCGTGSDEAIQFFLVHYIYTLLHVIQ